MGRLHYMELLALMVMFVVILWSSVLPQITVTSQSGLLGTTVLVSAPQILASWETP